MNGFVSPPASPTSSIPDTASGCRFIPIGSDDATVALATQTSETRRALFEGDQYRPRDYRVVMQRENVLQFYETTGRPRL